MAKATTKAPKPKKKAVKAQKAVTKVSPKSDKKSGGKTRGAADALWKLAEHPLIGELLAVGATAAVAAIAEQGLSGKGGKKNANSKAVKAAGKAAAAAIGARLIGEFAEGAGRKAAKPAKE